MGGHAFEEDKLPTPRIPPATYRLALHQVEQKLSGLFQKVAFPIEGPGKSDYGDLDVLVLPFPDRPDVNPEVLIAQLNAKKWKPLGCGANTFAIPWPESHGLSPDSLSTKAAPPSLDNADPGGSSSSQLGSQERYIQLDLRITSSQTDFDWRLFNHAHGDFVNILSTIIRPKGLTITDQALYLRIIGFESRNRKVSRIELTRSPTKALEYLGLDPARYFSPFATLDEMMLYIASCRFHDPSLFKGSGFEKRHIEEATGVPWKTSYQKRLERRPIFAYWFGNFLPKHGHREIGSAATLSRDEVLEDAFAWFPGKRAEYEERKEELEANCGRQDLWKNVKERLNTAAELNDTDMHDTLKALKKEVIPVGEDSKAELTEVQRWHVANDFEGVIAWCVENHAGALSRYRASLAENLRRPLDETKTNKFSTSDKETYSAEDDRKIVAMKDDGKSWTDIMTATRKESRSQLIAHYKQNLREH